MRYLVGFVFVLALTTSPPSVAAQSSDETSPHAAAPFTLEYQPAVQPYEEARGRVLQSRNGLIGSSVVVGLGAALIGGGVALQRNLNQRPPPPRGDYVRLQRRLRRHRPRLSRRSHRDCGPRRNERIGSQLGQTQA
jgi:hypothetical protein